jgi:hypothetical protein
MRSSTRRRSHVQAEQRDDRQHENRGEAVTVPRVASVPEALDEDEFGRLFADCELCSARIRSGLVPFDAACIARGLAAHSGHDEQTALEGLARWAGSVGGELNGSTLLWLPADRFGAAP